MTMVKDTVEALAETVLKKVVALAPDSWIPGGAPDPLMTHKQGLIGAQVPRVDGPLKVTGQARFAGEFPMEGMLYAALLHSTIAKGRLAAIETADAEAADGVALVMTHRNAPTMKPTPVFLSSGKAAGGDNMAIMQDDRIHWNGQPIAVVLADSQEQADHATSLIRVTYAPETARTDLDAEKAGAVLPPSVVGEAPRTAIGDAEAALAAAPHTVDRRYLTPHHNHNAIELHAMTLAWRGDDLFVHDASQGVASSAWTIAQVFGIDEKQVHLTSLYVGGGFGGKTLWRHQLLAAAAAKLAGRPVRLTLSREGVYRTVGGRSPTEQRVAIGADADGRFRALIHTGVTANTAHNDMVEPFTNPTRHLYRADAIELEVRAAALDMLANTFMRAPGESVGSFALECAIDELAEQLGLDPIELRLRNEPERDPTSNLPFSSRHLTQAYRTGAERFGWDKRNLVPRQRRDGEWLVGMGVATATYPYTRMPGGAARLTLHRDGSAEVATTANDMGMGTETVQMQVAAERLGLSMEQVRFRYGDSGLPGNVIAGGSQQTVNIGASVIVAHRKLVAELLKLAGNDSALAGLSVDEVGSRNGGLAKLDDPERWESYTSILARADKDSVAVEASAPPPLETMHWSMHSYGAQFCEVRVNTVTGEIRIARFLGSFDCGRILNARTAASQFRGGIIMGLGAAMSEQTQVDPRSGRVMNPSLAEYHVAVHADVPEIDVIWTDIPDPHAPMGAHGVGEIGITGVAAAVANAIHNATGKRVRELPITLDKLM